MLKIIVPAGESYDAENNLFVSIKETQLTLEHSLLSISKWEARNKKCFLELLDPKNDERLTNLEFLDYVKCMTINQNVDPNVYSLLSRKNVKSIIEYLNDPACATTVSHLVRPSSKKRIKNTAEVIYYYMITAGIPIECERWHINRLLTLIDVCATMGGGKKMSQADTAAMYASLNASRKKSSGSRG